MPRLLSIALLVAALCGTADAGGFVGGTLTDRAALHVVRIGAGLQVGRWTARATVDPMVLSDGQHTLDVAGEIAVGRGIALSLGWRDTTIGVDGGTRNYHSVVVAASAPLVKADWIELRGGIEFSQLVVAHGADAPMRWFDANPIATFPLGLFIEGRHAF